MLDVVFRRVLSLIPVIFIVTLIAFFVQIAIGGNPAYALAGLTATPGQIHEIERQEHLSQPAIERYWYWLNGLFHGNLGISYASERPVTTELGHYFPVTLSLTIAALVLIIVIGVPLGILQGRKAGTAARRGTGCGSALGRRQPSRFEDAAIAVFPSCLASNAGAAANCGSFSVSQERRCHAQNLVVILQKLVNFASRVKQNVLAGAGRRDRPVRRNNGGSLQPSFLE